MLKQNLQNEVVVALKAQENKKVNTLRGVIAIVKNAEIDKKSDLTDVEVQAIIKKQVKNLTEAKGMFEKGGRADLVAENEIEINLLNGYLPAEVSVEDIEPKIIDILAKNEGNTNIGQLIGICVRELKNIAEPSHIAEMVKKLKS